MKNLNKNKEWDFIKQEIVFNKPKRAPYKGKDLLKRELLFGLRGLLINYLGQNTKGKKEFLEGIYKSTNGFYLNF